MKRETGFFFFIKVSQLNPRKNMYLLAIFSGVQGKILKIKHNRKWRSVAFKFKHGRKWRSAVIFGTIFDLFAAYCSYRAFLSCKIYLIPIFIYFPTIFLTTLLLVLSILMFFAPYSRETFVFVFLPFAKVTGLKSKKKERNFVGVGL